MFEQSAAQTSFPLTSSAEDSPAKTFRARAKELASLVLKAASGTSSLASLKRCARAWSSSRTSPAELTPGSTPCEETWKSSGMRRYRSRLAQLIAERVTYVDASFLWPTLTAADNMLSPSMQKWAGHRHMLPTLMAQDYGSNQGGAAGREGKVRHSIMSLVRNGLLPTMTASMQDKGGTPENKHQRGLPVRSLSLQWCLWFMGFAEGWLQTGEEPSGIP